MNILGIDIGGTFTDFVLLCDGRLTMWKLPTTPDDPSQALLQGVALYGMPDTLVHGTTIATNALLERRGAVTALLTTKGFADVLAIGRGVRPSLYDLQVAHALPIVPASLRIEIPERIAADGTVLQAWVPHETQGYTEDMQCIVQHLIDEHVESVAICFLHSYRNSTHEQAIAAYLRAIHDEHGNQRFFVCASSDVLPEYREYERTSTTVVNAYVAPVLDRYLGKIEHVLQHPPPPHTHTPRLYIMASDGGSMTSRMARQFAARTTLSGPAGGVVGVRALAQQAGIEHIISFDMGGTSTDVALCDDFPNIPQTTESCIGGMPVRFPAIAIHTVGAGGGSIARVDAGGALRVGPQSAGADPGPACYGRGTLPTVTDANLFLGRLRAEHFLGGTMPLDTNRAETALAALADTLGMDVTRTALGIVRIANAAMERAIRTISVERGKDPRDCTLVAFGGAGPLHAAYLADTLGIHTVLVPRYPGVLSAFGMITADISRDYVAFVGNVLTQTTPDEMIAAMMCLATQAQTDMAIERESSAAPTLRGIFTLDVRYVEQSHEITTPLDVWEDMQPHIPNFEALAQRFHALHRQHSGHAMLEQPIEIVALRLKCILATGSSSLPTTEQDQDQDQSIPTNATHGHHSHSIAVVEVALAAESTTCMPTTLYAREHLHCGDTINAPAIVVQYDTTCVIPPGWKATIDTHKNLFLTTCDTMIR